MVVLLNTAVLSFRPLIEGIPCPLCRGNLALGARKSEVLFCTEGCGFTLTEMELLEILAGTD